MRKFNKLLISKLIALVVIVTFSVTSTAYGVDLSRKSHLRKPLLFNKKVDPDGASIADDAIKAIANLPDQSPSSIIKKPRSKIKRYLLVAATALFLFVGGYFFYIYQQVKNNPTFAPFFAKTSTSLVLDNADISDSVSDRLLREKLGDNISRINEVREFLREFRPDVRHIIISNLKADQFEYLNKIPHGLHGLIEFLESGVDDIRFKPGSNKTSATDAQRMWEALAGEPYVLKKVLYNYLEDSGPFAKIDFKGSVSPVSDNVIYFLHYLSLAETPIDFKIAYLNIVRQYGYPSGPIQPASFERAYNDIKSFSTTMWRSREHYEKAVAFIVDFNSSSNIFLPLELGGKILKSEGGLESIFLRLNTEPELHQRIIAAKVRFVDYGSTFGTNLFDYISDGNLKDIYRFLDGVGLLIQSLKLQPYNLWVAFQLIHDSGFPMTSDMPAAMLQQGSTIKILKDWLGSFLIKNQAKYQPVQSMDIERIGRLWKAFAILKKEALFQRYIDLSSAHSFIEPHEVPQILKAAKMVSDTYLKRVLKAIEPYFYDALSANIGIIEQPETYRSTLKSMYASRAFFDLDSTKYPKYHAYFKVLQSIPLERLTRLTEELTIDDFDIFVLFITELEKTNDKMAYELMGGYIRKNIIGQVDAKGIEAIENTRQNLNKKGYVLGDKFIVLICRQFIDDNKPSTENMDLYYSATQTWMEARKVVENQDIAEIYKLGANFIGNHAITYLLKNSNIVSDSKKLLKKYEALGFEIPSNKEIGFKINTAMQKFVANAVVGNWRYLKDKVSSASDNIDVDKFTVKDNAEWKLSPGFDVKEIYSGSKKIAYLIRGNPKQGARCMTAFDVGYRFGGVTSSNFDKKYDIVLDFPLAFTTGKGKPTDLAVENGEVKNWLMSLYRNFGFFIIYEDGTVHIADKSNLKISDLYKDKSEMKMPDRELNLGDINDYWRFLSIAGEQKLSINTNMLLVDGDYVAIINDGRDWRRLLIEFKDGSFGVLNMTIKASTGDATRLALELGARKAIYGDTGYYDFMTLHTLNKGFVVLGHSDNPASSNRVFFYQLKSESGHTDQDKPEPVDSMDIRRQLPRQSTQSAI